MARFHCRSKLSRELSKYRKKIREEENLLSAKMNGLCIDVKKDATLVMLQKGRVRHRQVVQEEHYILVGGPGECYLNQIST